MRRTPEGRVFSRPVGRRARRGIYLLPSLLTVGNIFAGYWAIIVAERGEFGLAGVLLIVAGLLDNLDGRVARVTGTTTAFGRQFDSLADAVSFGVAPAFMVYMWGMQPLGRIGWLGSFLFVVCGAMRLARYNIQILPDRRFFAGLPIPAGALVIATLMFYRPRPIQDLPLAMAVFLLVLTLSGLMVSRLRYPSFKGLDGTTGRHSFLMVALLALLLAAIAIAPQVALLSLALLYMLSGLLPRRMLAGQPAARRAPPSRTAGSQRQIRVVDIDEVDHE